MRCLRPEWGARGWRCRCGIDGIRWNNRANLADEAGGQNHLVPPPLVTEDLPSKVDARELGSLSKANTITAADV